MKLPFSCKTVSLLIDFAYDQELPPLDEQTTEDLLGAADYTVSQRLTAYLLKMSSSSSSSTTKEVAEKEKKEVLQEGVPGVEQL